MNFLFFILLSLCVTFAVGMAPKRPRKRCDFSCKGLPNGDYADPCLPPCSKTYYTCWNNVREPQKCRRGELFDESVGACVDQQWCKRKPEPPKCTFSCKGLPNGDYADPCLPDCSNTYYTCWNGVVEAQKCRRGDAFDDSVGACVDKQWCKPKCSFSCKGLPNGDYADPCLPECSSSYYTCWNGVVETQVCRRGEGFDDSVGACVDLEWCKPKPKRPRKPTRPKCFFDCKGLPNGDYADPCLPPCSNTYYTCWNGVEELQSCARGDAYDENVGACVDKQWCKPRKPEKPTPKCTFDCKGKPNGDYADPCVEPCTSRNYYTCWNGQVEAQICRKGDVYHEDQGCVDREWCKPKCSFSCKGLPNGDYADPCLPDCSNTYYTCWNGVVEAQKCRRGDAFDESVGACVDKQWCKPGKPSPKPSCKGLPDGTFGNECEKDFLICWEGEASSGSCSGKEVFDGVDSCVDCEAFDCPWKGFKCH